MRPPIALVESGINSGQVSLMRPVCIENCISVMKQVVLIARVVSILSGLYSETLLGVCYTLYLYYEYLDLLLSRNAETCIL